jgi:hypothetical protein
MLNALADISPARPMSPNHTHRGALYSERLVVDEGLASMVIMGVEPGREAVLRYPNSQYRQASF